MIIRSINFLRCLGAFQNLLDVVSGRAEVLLHGARGGGRDKSIPFYRSHDMFLAINDISVN
jgi:hypothetical protein